MGDTEPSDSVSLCDVDDENNDIQPISLLTSVAIRTPAGIVIGQVAEQDHLYNPVLFQLPKGFLSLFKKISSLLIIFILKILCFREPPSSPNQRETSS
jgi:hypothetical protein